MDHVPYSTTLISAALFQYVAAPEGCASWQLTAQKDQAQPPQRLNELY
jgi:hypothetical protein